MNNFQIGDIVMVYKVKGQKGLIVGIDRDYYRVHFFYSFIPTAWYSEKSLIKVS